VSCPNQAGWPSRVGSIVATDDEKLWKRAVMYHDVIGGQRLGLAETLCGVNYRLSELQAAVALVQIGRLEGLLAAMRERKRLLKGGLEDVARRKGLPFRQIVDPEGEAAIALIFFAPDAALARRIAAALTAENVEASLLYEPDERDYHVYAHWEPVLSQRTWTPNGGPWRWARREVRYDPGMCPRSLDLLGRAVHLDVNPLLSNEDVEETLEGANRVLEAVA
jgi:dTDP-4-amino-4,6-dideoxygalactose transaminase